jgi:hypothetical protein
MHDISNRRIGGETRLQSSQLRIARHIALNNGNAPRGNFRRDFCANGRKHGSRTGRNGIAIDHNQPVGNNVTGLYA